MKHFINTLSNERQKDRKNTMLTKKLYLCNYNIQPEFAGSAYLYESKSVIFNKQ